MIAHIIAVLLILLMIAIPVSIIVLIFKIVYTYDIHYREFKNYIYKKELEYDKLSFLKFLFLFEEYNAKADKSKVSVYYSQPSYEVIGYIWLKPYVVMLENQKFVYFGFLDYLAYYVWLHIFTRREDKRRNFASKRKNGLFEKSEK